MVAACVSESCVSDCYCVTWGKQRKCIVVLIVLFWCFWILMREGLQCRISILKHYLTRLWNDINQLTFVFPFAETRSIKRMWRQSTERIEFDPTPTTGYATWRTSMNRGSRMQNGLIDSVTLTFDLLTPKHTTSSISKDHWTLWDHSFLSYAAEKNRQTIDRQQTDGRENPIHASNNIVGVGKK